MCEWTFKLTTNWAFNSFVPSTSVTISISPGRMLVVPSTPPPPHHSPHEGVPHAAVEASHPAALRVGPPAVSGPAPHVFPASPRIPFFFVCQNIKKQNQ